MSLYDISKLSTTQQQQLEESGLLKSFPTSLLSVGNDPKTVKGEKYGYLTGIMYLAPHMLSGHNLCPLADLARCHVPCLNTAGRGTMTSVQVARLRKTLFFQQYRAKFFLLLYKDIKKLEKKAQKLALHPVVRLNGTSDIQLEKTGNTGHLFRAMIKSFPLVKFYDYTKFASRLLDRDYHSLENYDLTLSVSNTPEYLGYLAKTFKLDSAYPKIGWRVVGAPLNLYDTIEALPCRTAVVYDKDRWTIDTEDLPEWRQDLTIHLGPGFKMLNDGNLSDLRFLEPKKSISCLAAKGGARQPIWQSGTISGLTIDIAKEFQLLRPDRMLGGL